MQERVEVRRMQAQDLDAVMQIEEASFHTPWSRQSMAQEVENRAAYYAVVTVQGELAAYGGAWLVIDEGHITNIAVHPAKRGRGYGELVTRALLDYLRSVDIRIAYLEVRRSNEAAKCLYKKLGFQVLSIRKRYYEDNGEDALVMFCLLDAPADSPESV